MSRLISYCILKAGTKFENVVCVKCLLVFKGFYKSKSEQYTEKPYPLLIHPTAGKNPVFGVTVETGSLALDTSPVFPVDVDKITLNCRMPTMLGLYLGNP